MTLSTRQHRSKTLGSIKDSILRDQIDGENPWFLYHIYLREMDKVEFKLYCKEQLISFDQKIIELLEEDLKNKKGV
jgi:hypothetical protein